MNIREIAAFVAVAEELHFGRAASRLHIAQPPLSQRIRRLEQELGVELFERTTRVVRLTPAGKAMLEPARHALEAMDLAERAAKSGGKGELGRVVLGFSGVSSLRYLPILTDAVRTVHPGLQLVLSRGDYINDLLTDVSEGVLDLAFIQLPIARPGLPFRPIGEERLHAVLPEQHRLSDRNTVQVAELAEEPFVTFTRESRSSAREDLVRVCLESGFSPRIAMGAPDIFTILTLVAAGVGVTLASSSVQHYRNEGVIFKALDGPPRTTIAALVWKSHDRSDALREVLTIAEEVLPTPPALR